MALPEFLTGAPFKKYDYEGTIVTAFSMAILQELNARNVLNPIAALREEVKYHENGDKRADIMLDLEALNLFTPELKNYGYFQKNWLEAKYFRLNQDGNPKIPTLNATFLLLKDIIRLCTLVPDKKGMEVSDSGRYLLHAYQRNPDIYLNKNGNFRKKRYEREWISKILSPGEHEINLYDLYYETTKTFDNTISPFLKYIKIKLKIKNLVHKPFKESDSTYYIVLSRIDDFHIQVSQRYLLRHHGVKYKSNKKYYCGRQGSMLYESHYNFLKNINKILDKAFTN